MERSHTKTPPTNQVPLLHLCLSPQIKIESYHTITFHHHYTMHLCIISLPTNSIITPSPLLYPTFSQQRTWPHKTTLPTLPQPHLMQLQAKTSSSLASLEAFQPKKPHFHSFLTPHLAAAPMTSLFPSPKPKPKTPPPPLASSLLSNTLNSSPPTAASPPS